MCHAGRLRFRRKNNAAAASLVAARQSKASSSEDNLHSGLHELAKTATIAGKSVSPAPGHDVAKKGSRVRKSRGDGDGGMCTAAAAAGSCGAATAVRSATPWLQSINIPMMGNLSNLGNLGNLTNNHTMSGFPPTSSSLADFSAAMGGSSQQGVNPPQAEELFNQIATLNVSLRNENMTLWQRVAVLSARLENQGDASCQHCGKSSGNGVNGNGNEKTNGSNNGASLFDQARQAVVGPMMAELEAMKQLQQQQVHRQHQHQHSHTQDTANLASLLAQIQSGSDTFFSSGGASSSMNSLNGLNKLMMASQAAFGGVVGSFHSQLNSQLLQQSFSHDGANPLYLSPFSQQGAWNADMAAAAVAANDAVRSLVMQANQQAGNIVSMGGNASSDPMAALLESVQVHQKAKVLDAAASRANLALTPAVLEAINKAGGTGVSSDKSNETGDNKVSGNKRSAPSNVSPADHAGVDCGDLRDGSNDRNGGNVGNGSYDDGTNQGEGERMGEHRMKRINKKRSSPDGSTGTDEDTMNDLKRPCRNSLMEDGSTDN